MVMALFLSNHLIRVDPLSRDLATLLCMESPGSFLPGFDCADWTEL